MITDTGNINIKISRMYFPGLNIINISPSTELQHTHQQIIIQYIQTCVKSQMIYFIFKVKFLKSSFYRAEVTHQFNISQLGLVGN